MFRLMKIRAATNADYDAVWKIFHEIVSAGDTYALDPKMSREEALAYWFRSDTHTYVAEFDRQPVGEADGFPGTATQPSPQATARQAPSPTASRQDQRIVGTYILRPNQSGGGSHVANAAFMVASDAQGAGVGRAMAEHCLSEARRMGFQAMQFNFVVSTNTLAIRLWEQLGFKIVGSLPGAFRHPEKGHVDVYVMYRSLLA
jgi:ribosomal protein S18 acetylase RimI-like enzyme